MTPTCDVCLNNLREKKSWKISCMSMDINLCYSYEASYIKIYSKTKRWHATTIIKPQMMPCTHVYLSFFYKIVKHENKFHFGFESCDYKKMMEESRKSQRIPPQNNIQTTYV
jgi:hypothetical protein